MKPMVSEIQKAVCHQYGLRKSDMASAERTRCVARPRQIAMFLAREMTTHSLPEIARIFGRRDHTTVFYAVERVRSLMIDIPEIALDVSRLRVRIQKMVTDRAVLTFREAA